MADGAFGFKTSLLLDEKLSDKVSHEGGGKQSICYGPEGRHLISAQGKGKRWCKKAG